MLSGNDCNPLHLLRLKISKLSKFPRDRGNSAKILLPVPAEPPIVSFFNLYFQLAERDEEGEFDEHIRCMRD